MLGFGFIFISIVLLANSGMYFALPVMLLGIFLLASGISQLVKADGAKATIQYRSSDRESLPRPNPDAELPPIRTEYIRPEGSTHHTEDLIKGPFSVTEPTTRLLEVQEDPKETGHKAS